MNTTTTDREQAMFGCTTQDLEGFLAKYVGEGKLFATAKDAAFSILSDAQEEMGMGRADRAERSINRAKWLLDRPSKLSDEAERLRNEVFRVRKHGDTDMATAQAWLSDVRDVLTSKGL